jgi:hypothetical protein
MAAEISKALVSNSYIRDGDVYRVLVGRPEGKRLLEGLGVDGWIIVK